jgi:hypothetical protein
VIAYGKGGALETITSTTGAFFHDPTPQAVAAAIQTFESSPLKSPTACRQNAERFSHHAFEEAMNALLIRIVPNP